MRSCCITQEAQTGTLCGVGGAEEVQEGGNIYILMTDSHCCKAEANTKL